MSLIFDSSDREDDEVEVTVCRMHKSVNTEWQLIIISILLACPEENENH